MYNSRRDKVMTAKMCLFHFLQKLMSDTSVTRCTSIFPSDIHTTFVHKAKDNVVHIWHMLKSTSYFLSKAMTVATKRALTDTRALGASSFVAVLLL
jgi:hypothetical protein